MEEEDALVESHATGLRESFVSVTVLGASE
jgi:hypothetical protein